MNGFLFALACFLALLSFVLAIVFGMQRNDVDIGKLPKHSGWLSIALALILFIASVVLMRNVGRVF